MSARVYGGQNICTFPQNVTQLLAEQCKHINHPARENGIHLIRCREGFLFIHIGNSHDGKD